MYLSHCNLYDFCTIIGFYDVFYSNANGNYLTKKGGFRIVCPLFYKSTLNHFHKSRFNRCIGIANIPKNV